MLPRKKQGDRELVRPSAVRNPARRTPARPKPKKRKSKLKRFADMFEDAFDIIEDILD